MLFQVSGHSEERAPIGPGGIGQSLGLAGPLDVMGWVPTAILAESEEGSCRVNLDSGSRQEHRPGVGENPTEVEGTSAKEIRPQAPSLHLNT